MDAAACSKLSRSSRATEIFSVPKRRIFALPKIVRYRNKSGFQYLRILSFLHSLPKSTHDVDSIAYLPLPNDLMLSLQALLERIPEDSDHMVVTRQALQEVQLVRVTKFDVRYSHTFATFRKLLSASFITSGISLTHRQHIKEKNTCCRGCVRFQARTPRQVLIWFVVTLYFVAFSYKLHYSGTRKADCGVSNLSFSVHFPQLVRQCNEGARAMEQMETLIELQNKIRFDSQIKVFFCPVHWMIRGPCPLEFDFQHQDKKLSSLAIFCLPKCVQSH